MSESRKIPQPTQQAESSVQATPTASTENQQTQTAAMQEIRPIINGIKKTSIDVSFQRRHFLIELDTGSDATLVEEAIVKKYGWKIQANKPRLIVLANEKNYWSLESFTYHYESEEKV